MRSVMRQLDSTETTPSERVVMLVGDDHVSDHNACVDEHDASCALFRTLVQTAPDLIMTLDAEGRIEFVNRSFPGKAALAVGTSLFDCLDPSDVELARAAVARALERGEPSHFEARLGTPDGEKRWCTNRIRRDEPKGRPPRLVVFSTDASERRQAEQALERAEAELEESRRRLVQSQKMESVGRLAGGVAHDFNNTLTVIVTLVRMLLDDLSPNDPRRSDLREVLRSADTATQLTRRLLSFSRRRAVEPAVIELNEAVTSIDKMLRQALGESIELAILPAKEPQLTLVDAGQLEQLVLNLSLNARDAMPHGGTLTIALSAAEVRDNHYLAPGRYVKLTVTDTGCGMDERVLDHLFEPFFTTKSERGTGLGLATCYGIVAQAGGDITVTSKVGAGTTFTIVFPACDPGAPEAAAAAPSPMPLRLAQGNTAVAVEDQPAILRIVTAVLRAAGFKVIDAGTAEEALSLIARQAIAPELLVTDVMLPGMCGVELGRGLSERFAKLRTLFISGYTGELSSSAIHANERTAFLPKPFSAADLRASVARLFAGADGM